MCDYDFAPGVFELCREWATSAGTQVIFLELGRVEAQKKGHYDTLMEVMRGAPTLVVACLRRSALAPIALELPDPDDFIELPAPDEQLAEFTAAVRKLAG